MSGWIKFEKQLETDPRVTRMARALAERYDDLSPRPTTKLPYVGSCNACALPGVTLVCGALARLWVLADSHARDDDTLDMTPEELDDWIGIPGFCQLMPDDWLRVVDEHTVELPCFQEHNGTEAKKRALNQKRVAQHRAKEQRKSITVSNASALPDQDQTKTIEDIRRPEADAPKRNGVDKGLESEIVAAYHELLPALPAVKVWNDRRHKKLSDRIRERAKAGKPADTVDYWRGLFSKVAASDFLCGRRGDWRADLEWLLESKNFTKVIEGHYDNSGVANGRG